MNTEQAFCLLTYWLRHPPENSELTEVLQFELEQFAHTGRLDEAALDLAERLLPVLDAEEFFVSCADCGIRVVDLSDERLRENLLWWATPKGTRETSIAWMLEGLPRARSKPRLHRVEPLRQQVQGESDRFRWNM